MSAAMRKRRQISAEAASELLAAIKAAMRHADYIMLHHEQRVRWEALSRGVESIIAVAMAAIAKAEGRS